MKKQIGLIVAALLIMVLGIVWHHVKTSGNNSLTVWNPSAEWHPYIQYETFRSDYDRFLNTYRETQDDINKLYLLGYRAHLYDYRSTLEQFIATDYEEEKSLLGRFIVDLLDRFYKKREDYESALPTARERIELEYKHELMKNDNIKDELDNQIKYLEELLQEFDFVGIKEVSGQEEVTYKDDSAMPDSQTSHLEDEYSSDFEKADSHFKSFGGVNAYEPYYFGGEYTHERDYIRGLDQKEEVRSILRTLSTAAETYATANLGNYPQSVDQLLNSNPPYIRENYCGELMGGYTIECEFSSRGYTVKAVPDQKEFYLFKITTGGFFSEEFGP